MILNAGSTSTKIAVFEGETPLFTENISHTAEELAPFERITDQFAFRKALVMECLERNNFRLEDLDAVVSRGGLLGPVQAGAYEINEDMVWQLKYRPRHEHAANVGALVARAVSLEWNIPAYIYDGITVDELTDINRLTGLKEFRRKGMGHNLNTRAAAMRYAREQGRPYQDITVIVAHLGGGITVNLQHKGRIVDTISDEEGPFSPERSGGLPIFDVIKACFEPDMTYEEMMKRVKRQGGLLSHLGTTDCVEVEQRIAAGNDYAKLVYDALALNVSKNIAKCAPVVAGKVDAILLTGGIACSQYIVDSIISHVSFLAPVFVYPGEDEMLALALGGLRVLRGQETARTYHKTDHPEY